MNARIEAALREGGADVVRFVDISGLPPKQTRGYGKAILFCMALSRQFVNAARSGVIPKPDEFVDKEHAADKLADWLAEHLRQQGHDAISQSEEANFQSGAFNGPARSSALPHKTVALFAGLGYIGKNNLLITEGYGCALVMCTVLTNAPLVTENLSPPSSACGECTICRDICPTGALSGESWTPGVGRDALLNVEKCKCALKCMVNCPKTAEYARG